MIFDALIIGGGPAGAITAWLLAMSGWSTVLVEKESFPRRKVCGEYISATNFPLLHKLCLVEKFLNIAGPPVREVGLFSGNYKLVAPMPDNQIPYAWGHALGREHLDTLLLNGARAAGTIIYQPCITTAISRRKDLFFCDIESVDGTFINTLQAHVVVAAHGSWIKGKLPSQLPKRKLRSQDLLAFKTHFTEIELAPGLMPLLAFPGGYGGMVHTDHGRVSLSCCIRYEILKHIRNDGQTNAGDAVLAHIKRFNDGARDSLRKAKQDGTWLSCGPISPGVRSLYENGIFKVGNAAGEAHPVVAEGISMAMQGAHLLSELLISNREKIMAGNSEAIGQVYENAWRRNFVSRIRYATIFAHLAMQPLATKILLPLLHKYPRLLTTCTQLSGKIAYHDDKSKYLLNASR